MPIEASSFTLGLDFSAWMGDKIKLSFRRETIPGFFDWTDLMLLSVLKYLTCTSAKIH